MSQLDTYSDSTEAARQPLAVRKILLTGQCSLHWGRMEYGNLGNYAIIEPLIRELHRVFPNAEIHTTFQMSEEFCRREDVQCLPLALYYEWKSSYVFRAAYEALAAWTRGRGMPLLPTTSFIRAVEDADLVIDFSGDIWGDNADLVGPHRFAVGVMKDAVASFLRKPVFLLAGSPGPFRTWFSRRMAASMLKRFDLVTNRESLSTEILKREGLPVDNIHSLACPAFLFEAHPDDAELSRVLKEEGIEPRTKPLVGFIVSGWNLPVGPFDRKQRDEWEFDVFAQAIEYVESKLGAQVCLLSHNNAFTREPAFQMRHGRDYEVASELKAILDKRGIAQNVFLLKGVYDCAVTKGTIRHLDMLVSGRIHAAVSGMSQMVPTVILDYGHEPKAHKLRGFAGVAGMTPYVADPSDLQDVIAKISESWEKRAEIRAHLSERIPEVQSLARANFDCLAEAVKTRFAESATGTQP